MGYNQKNFRIILPITIGTEPFHGSTPGIYILHGRQTVLPSAPELLEQIEPTASQLPDDDTVSIRTYASTPPPFPDDGKFAIYLFLYLKKLEFKVITILTFPSL